MKEIYYGVVLLLYSTVLFTLQYRYCVAVVLRYVLQLNCTCSTVALLYAVIMNHVARKQRTRST